MAKTNSVKKIKIPRVVIYLLLLGVIITKFVLVDYCTYQNELNAELKNVKQELKEEVTLGQNLHSEKIRRMDIANVEQYAVRKLHMQKIMNYQIQYVQVDKDAKIEVLNIEEETTMDKFTKSFNAILDFFRGG